MIFNLDEIYKYIKGTYRKYNNLIEQHDRRHVKVENKVLWKKENIITHRCLVNEKEDYGFNLKYLC